MRTEWTGRGLVKGEAQGPVLLSRTPLSFLGDLDIRTGKIVGAMCDLKGENLGGAVLVVPATHGSAGAWRFIYQLKQHRTHPAAIITQDLPDPSVVQGAILSAIPIVAGLADQLCAEAPAGAVLAVDGRSGRVRFLGA